MVILGSWRGQSLTLSIKPNCLTLSLQSGPASSVYSWDNAGRLWTGMLEGISYRRGLDGKLVAKWQTASGGRDRRWLPGDEAVYIQENARAVAQALLDDLRSNRLVLSPSPSLDGLAVLARATAFDTQHYRDDTGVYARVYKPVGILPPDQYMAVVLQAAEGCSFNTCTYCNFYKDRRFRIKTTAEFRSHAEAVRNFLGEGLSLRRTVFLGDANALVIPMPRLVPLLETTHSIFDVERLGGIFAFLDGFSGEKKSAQDFAQLARLGLQRVYIGLESGHDPLLNFLRKPGRAQDAVQAVRAMKTGGVAVGIIILLGAGGKQYSRAHVRDTIAVVNQMGLDADDLIYFSELVESEGMQYSIDAYAQNLEPLNAQERQVQGEEIETALNFSKSGGVPHISRYDIREFVY